MSPLESLEVIEIIHPEDPPRGKRPGSPTGAWGVLTTSGKVLLFLVKAVVVVALAPVVLMLLALLGVAIGITM